MGWRPSAKHHGAGQAPTRLRSACTNVSVPCSRGCSAALPWCLSIPGSAALGAPASARSASPRAARGWPARGWRHRERLIISVSSVPVPSPIPIRIYRESRPGRERSYLDKVAVFDRGFQRRVPVRAPGTSGITHLRSARGGGWRHSLRRGAMITKIAAILSHARTVGGTEAGSGMVRAFSQLSVGRVPARDLRLPVRRG